MSVRFTLVSFFVVGVSLLASACPALASHNPNSNDHKIPEVEGTYDDPDHPGVKVKVFVHKEKRASHTTSNILACDLQDPDSSTPIAPAGWHLPANWTYRLNTSSVPSSVGGANLVTMAANGFNSWKAASANKVNFTQGTNTLTTRSSYDSQNIIAWGRTSGSTLGVTYIWYYPSTGLAVDVDTIMNRRVPWRWANSLTCANTDSYDAENILTHEQGHWMGLDDEYNQSLYQHATMFGYGAKGEVKKVTLTTGDISGVKAIYP